MPIAPEIVFVAIVLLVFSLLLILAVSRFRARETVVFHLALYAGLGFFLGLSLLVSLLNVTTLSPINQYYTNQFILLALILTFGALTLNFLKRDQKTLVTYWSGGFVILLLWSFFVFNPQGWAEAAANYVAGLSIGINQTGELAMIAAGLGWIMAVITSLVALAVDFRKRQATQYLNRLRYWLITTTLLSVSGLILFAGPYLFNTAGLLLLALGSGLAGFTVVSYHAPDLKLLIGRAIFYLAVTAILTTVFALGLATAIIISRNKPNANDLYVLFWTIVVAIFLAIIFPPLWRFSNRFLGIIIFGKNYYDRSQVIKHYSQNISSALDLNRLGDITINLMIETLGIEQGIVFVRERADAVGYSMRPLSSVGLTDLTTGHFTPDSPLIVYLREGKKIVSQYDIEVLPRFRSMPEHEQAWLSGLNMELYVGILLQHELIGLLAFGPQPQGTAYYEEDLELMIALAERVAPAIDNARLFEQLAVINQEVGQLTDQLAGLDQDKADFLSIASHELRTPLTHIHGYSRMLLDLTEEELKDPGYVKTIIQGIAKGSERMKDVVDMMFDVTEANIGEMNLFLGPVALEDVIEQASRPFLPALDQRRIAFSKTGIQELPAIEADGTRLVQAFENLIGNAVKYTPDGGMIKVEGRTVEADGLGPAVEIVVEDTGIGIDPEHHERIFEKFFRVDDTLHHSTGKTKFKGAGPGLGLTLVRGIAEAHGGRVWVESLGHDEINFPGTKFFFVIPIKRLPPQEVPKQSAIETRHWRRKDMQLLDE
ncbi:MAG: GAF domain-containing sensor histidine kinase [Anaerolineales bacterium]|nr:GAF domain-containing sensor histidine kinase [Anaerolineales bacterium]